MRQTTLPDQTAKLIELGFEKPSNTIVKEEPIYREGSIIDWKPIAEEGEYSIGELIEMLGFHLSSIYYIGIVGWVVNAEGLERRSEELVDSLYDMVVKLKEEGII